ITPKTFFGKLFTMFYVFIGLGLIVSFVGIIGKIQIEEYKKFENEKNRISKKIAGRFLKK
ncbi:MAG: ion channel, partial [Candidatus ainarchaeum sp.]|nr:ion channel [Candidatus ainarchaeum sp.]